MNKLNRYILTARAILQALRYAVALYRAIKNRDRLNSKRDRLLQRKPAKAAQLKDKARTAASEARICHHNLQYCETTLAGAGMQKTAAAVKKLHQKAGAKL